MVMVVSRHYWPGWRREAVGPLIRFGLPLSMANLINWSLLNADYVILGRLISAAAVGVYMIAFSVANWSTAVLGSVLNGVVIPSFGRVHDDPARVRSALLSSIRLVGLVTFPIGMMTIALAPSLVAAVFGQRWLAAVPVLQVLGIYGIFYSFSLLMANVLVALGVTSRLLGVQVLWILVVVPLLVLGANAYGLVGAAWAHVVAVVLVAIPAYSWFLLRHIGGRPLELIRVLANPAAAAALAGACGGVVSRAFGSPWTGFLLGGVVGAAVYLPLTWRLLGPVVRSVLPHGPRAGWEEAAQSGTEGAGP